MIDFMSLKAQLIIWAVVISLFAVLGGWWYIRGQEIDNLNLRVQNLTEQVEIADKRIAQANEANRLAAAVIESQRMTANSVNEIVRNLRAREGNNDQVSPIIRDAFDSIERLRTAPQRSPSPADSPRQP